MHPRDKKHQDRLRHLVKVVSVKELVHAVLTRVKGRLLSGLMILGHGCAGVQGVGLSSLGHVAEKDKDKEWLKQANEQDKAQPHLESEGSAYNIKADSDGIRSLRTNGDGELVGDGQLLHKFKGKFTAHATVVLGGCKVGAGDKGDDLLRAVSAIFGNIRVQAGVETQYPLKEGCEGKCKEAHNGDVYEVDATHQSKLWRK
jgi:hypothetical protein